MPFGARTETPDCQILMTLKDFLNHLVIIEDLEGVVEDSLNNPDLPTGIGDVAA